MSKSIFTQIINRNIPANIIYETDTIIAFLDINPVSKGHTLVVPKNEIEFIWDLSGEDYHNLMNAVKVIGVHLRKTLGVPYVGQQVVGVDVPHAHIHLIPFTDVSEFRAAAGSYKAHSNDMIELANALRLP